MFKKFFYTFYDFIFITCKDFLGTKRFFFYLSIFLVSYLYFFVSQDNTKRDNKYKSISVLDFYMSVELKTKIKKEHDGKNLGYRMSSYINITDQICEKIIDYHYPAALVFDYKKCVIYIMTSLLKEFDPIVYKTHKAIMGDIKLKK